MSQASAGRTFLLLGEQSLLVRCGDLLLAHGHRIAAVVTEERRVREWAARQGLVLRERFESLQSDPLPDGVDYLLSITNLRVLPDWLLGLPRLGAFNFHDGPLPRYAGLNAPAWALLGGEREHGVAWHELTAGLDRGRLVATRRFAIEPDDTAFSLNARCYEAGYETFAGLLEQLESGALRPVEQDRQARSYFGLERRPAAAGCLDWTRDAADLARQVRALDFGPYPNPLLLPKLDLGGSLLLVREAAPENASVPPGPAGSVARTAGGEVAVCCGRGALLLGRVTDIAGNAVDAAAALSAAGFATGDTLPPAPRLRELDERVRVCARHEAWWLRQFRDIELTPAPYVQRDAARDTDTRHDIPALQTGAGRVAAALLLLLARLANRRDLAIAHVPRSLADIEASQRRFFAPRAILAARFDAAQDFAGWEQALSGQLQRCEERVGWLSDLPARRPDIAAALLALQSAPVALLSVAHFDDAQRWIAEEGRRHALLAVVAADGACRLVSPGGALAQAALARIATQLSALLERVADGAATCGDVSVLDAQDEHEIARWSGRSDLAALPPALVHEQFEAQVARDPSRRACVSGGEATSYGELNAAANRIARFLVARGVARGDRVGIRIPRGTAMVAAMLGALKAGAAYVPLDPAWPRDRLRLMEEDAGLRLTLGPDEVREAAGAAEDVGDLRLAGDPSDLAYLIYTSGSTGRPKGVMVEHRQVVNFFAGIDQRFGTEPGTWLAVTSISFDISVLELLWTLARGFTVVIHGDALRLKGRAAAAGTAAPAHGPAFGLFYWNVARPESDNDADKYRLLLESARFADTHGFNAVWTPERHFESFGGLFPNPSVTSAALATITRNVQLRAGSCVVPLHSPIRIAEEWAVVDNLSNGRVGISVASGWAMPDFAIRPENFANAKQVMLESTAILRRLWRGETVAFPGPKGEVQVRTLPRPVQPELPVWVTTAGNPETWAEAGRIGANVLTHLLGQTVEEVAGKVALYRKAWAEAGHPGRGLVTLMLHTLVGEDEEAVERTVRQPMKDYLRSAVALVKAAAWQFPTFRKLSEEQGRTLDQFFADASGQDMDELLEFAFQRYYRDSGLFGTPQRCLQMVGRVNAAGIDEIACLIDFGIAADTVLAHLPHLDVLRRLAQGGDVAADARAAPDDDHSLATLLRTGGITHLQCTPTMATMLAADTDALPGLAGLRELLVGGEALAPELARRLSQLVRGRISNMYGPTETTVWSAAGTVDAGAITPSNSTSIGTPLLNQSLRILDERQQPLPPGVVGEIAIGGAGVTRGYWQQPEQTAARFTGTPPLYRTGDLGRLLPDGRFECLGRSDQQVKIRGYRVELGEIEAVLREQPGVAEAAVVVRQVAAGDQRLLGFVTAAAGGRLDGAQVRQALAQRLPEYMVPAIHEVAAMPLTPNGKLDRKALAAPAGAPRSVAPGLSSPPSPAPSTPRESPPVHDATRLVLDVWRRALGVEQIGLRDNFFDIGGHSLLVIQVLQELRGKVERPIQMTDLFRYTTVESLARFLGEGAGAEPASGRGRDRATARRLARSRN